VRIVSVASCDPLFGDIDYTEWARAFRCS
jgi:hypothetical protein